MSDSDLPGRCDAWIRLFSELGERGVPDLRELETIAVREVRFSDPFNDISGLANLQRLLEHTREKVRDVSFTVSEQAVSGDRVYLLWRMTGRVALVGDWQVEGMSRVELAGDGRVSSHTDYWDASRQFYARLPVIGWLIRRLSAAAGLS